MTSRTSLTAGNLLAVDTSGSRGTLALGRIESGRLADVEQTAWDKKAIHSEIATVKLQDLLAKAGLSLTDLSHIAVNVGPGSFTGIRVGINLARTLAYACGIPIVGICALDLLAAKNSKVGDSTFVAIKAIQDFFYCASFQLTSLGLDQRLAPSSHGRTELDSLAANSTKVLIEGQTPGFTPVTEAQDLLTHVFAFPDQSRFLSWKEVHPIYIRASEAEEKLLKGLLKREF